MNKKIVMVVLLSIACGIMGCNPDNRRKNNETVESTTCGNITMGQGKFAYNNDFIYYAGIGTFYEYDMLSKETITFSSKDVAFPDCIYIDGEYLYFAGGGLQKITRDGKKMSTVYDNTKGDLQLYVDDTKAYFMDTLDGTLYCRDMKSGLEEALLTGMLSYHIDNGNIYAVAKNNNLRKLYKSRLENISFEQIELEFEPITVLAAKDTLYLAQKESYELVQYEDGVETMIPIVSTYYQVINNYLIYLDSDTYENSCFDLKIYNLETKEVTIICEDVFNFCVFLDKYIAIERFDANFLYDMETETLEMMYEIE